MDVFGPTVRAHRELFRDAAAMAAHRLGIFDALSQPADVPCLARVLGVRPRRLRTLLDVLVFDGALRRDGEVFLLHAVPPRPAFVPEQGFGLLAEVIRSDRPLEDPLMDPDGASRYQSHLIEAGAEAAVEVAERFISGSGSRGRCSLLDAGGGAGTYSRAFLRASPDGTATLVDRPGAVAMARETLLPFDTRVSLVEGDIQAADLGSGHDVALLANVLHLHPPDVCEALVARVASALAPGGVLLVKDFLVTPDRRESEIGLLFSLGMALYTEGGEAWDHGRIAGWLRGAGLSGVELFALRAADYSVVLRAVSPGLENATPAAQNEATREGSTR